MKKNSRFLFPFTLFLFILLFVSCIQNPIPSTVSAIQLVQLPEGVQISLKKAVLGIEIRYSEGKIQKDALCNPDLLTIQQSDRNGDVVSFSGSGAEIPAGTILFTLPGSFLDEITIHFVQVYDSASMRASSPFSSGFSLKDATVNPAAEFDLEIVGKSVSNLGGFEFWVEYDPALLEVNSSGGSIITLLGPCSSGLVISPVYSTGQIKIPVAFTSGVNLSSTETVILKIKMRAKSVTGNAYVRFGTNTTVLNASAVPMSVGLYPGTITIAGDGPVLLGDFNLDEIVDLVDFVAFANHYGSAGSVARYQGQISRAVYEEVYDIAPAENRFGGGWADIYDYATPDGQINLFDFVVFGANYGKQVPEDNQNPTPPTSPSPGNGSTGVSTTPILSWNSSSDPDGDAVTYDVYLDTTSNPTTLKTPSSISVTQLQITALSASTLYYWKVIAKDNRGGSNSGGPWSFTTQALANQPPTAPTNSAPANHSTGIAINATISWTASTDPNGDTVSYDLYWDTFSNPTTLRAPNLSSTSYQVSNLSEGTKYYWKVVAKDGQGGSTAGSIWDFTTVTAQPGSAQYRALTVGLTTYDSPGNDLDAPDDDAYDLQQMLSHLTYGYTTTVQVGRVTKSELNTLLTSYVSGSQAQDVFLFHYSGHGAYSAGQSYLYMSDDQSMTVTELRQKLSAINGTKIVLIDACESGSFVSLDSGRELTREEKLDLLQKFNENVLEVFSQPSENRGSYNSPYQYYVLTGSAISELSNEDTELNNGFMTFFLNDGLGDVGSDNPNGAFDYTYNADGYGAGGVVNNQITFKEIYLYTRDRVQSYISSNYGEVQTVQGTPANSDYVIGVYSGGSANNPPSAPSSPSPSNGSSNISLSQTLGWSSSGATSYDVYFGTTQSPSIVSSNQAAATYNPGTLIAETTYYWKVEAKNAYGNTMGALWSFTTQSSTPPSGEEARVILKSPTPEIIGSIAFDYTGAFYDSQNTTPPHWKVNQDGSLFFTFTGQTDFYFNIYGIPAWGDDAEIEAYVNGEYFGYAALTQDWETWYLEKESLSTGENEVEIFVSWGTLWIDEAWITLTQAPPNNPPSAPADANPANGAGNVGTNPTLSWSSLGATSYKVYFGTQSNPPLVNSNVTQDSYVPSGPLTNGSTYYWKIEAVNAYGSTVGSIWSFVVQTGATGGVDFTGPVYTGDTLLVSNESSNGGSTSNTGSLVEVRNRFSSGLSARKTILELEAYRLNPKRLFLETDSSRLIQPDEEGLHARAVGETRTFWTYDFKTEMDEQITATLQAIGTRCLIWVQSTSEISTTKAQQLATEFDNAIWSSVTSNFYTPSDVNGDSKVAILCFDVQDDFDTTGSYVGGYFWAGDLYDQTASNRMEIFYIDTYPTMHYPSSNPADVTEAYSTLAHEFQHMVNYNRNVLIEGGNDMDSWLDEGLSMAAEHIIYGTLTSRINYYNTAPSIKNGHSVLYWDDAGDTLSNYSLSYLFLQYVRVQMNQGNAIFKEILQDTMNDYRAVENAAKTYITSTLSFGDFMTNYRLALFMKESTGSYGFKGESAFNAIAAQMYTGSGTNLRGGGGVYKAISGSFTDPGNAGANIQYAAIP